MEDVTERLLTTPPADLRIDRLAVLQWYDGPIEGYLRIADPDSCWHFEVIAAAYPEKGPGDRQYALSAAPDDVFGHLREFLEPPSTGRVWTPRGSSGTAEDRSAADRALDRLKQLLPGPALVVRSTLCLNVTAVWRFSVG